MEFNMKKYLVSFCFFMLSVMSFSSFADMIDVTHEFKPNGELANCKIFYLSTGGFVNSSIYITKCPDSSKTNTTYNSKYPVHSSYIEESKLSNEKYPVLNKDKFVIVNNVKYYELKNINSNETININGKIYYKE
jgi:hypothetical protein